MKLLAYTGRLAVKSMLRHYSRSAVSAALKRSRQVSLPDNAGQLQWVNADRLCYGQEVSIPDNADQLWSGKEVSILDNASRMLTGCVTDRRSAFQTMLTSCCTKRSAFQTMLTSCWTVVGEHLLDVEDGDELLVHQLHLPLQGLALHQLQVEHHHARLAVKK